MENDLDQKSIEFKIFGISIEILSIVYGIFLILTGIAVSLLSNSDSITSYIPSFFGFPILLFSYLSIKFTSKKKLFMHIVVFLGLIVLIGGLDFIRSIINGNLFENFWADTSKLIMFITGLFFVYQCVRSFIHARKNRNINN